MGRRKKFDGSQPLEFSIIGRAKSATQIIHALEEVLEQLNCGAISGCVVVKEAEITFTTEVKNT